MSATSAAFARAFDEPIPRAATADPVTPGGALGTAGLRTRYLVAGNVRYGPAAAHRLDIWRRPGRPPDPNAPVLVFVPGGAWVMGTRRLQGYGLLAHLAEQGWTCVSIDYRVAPRHRWPAHIRDVKRALGWVRQHVATPSGFVAVAGASAGGHLAALAGLCAEEEYRPEDVGLSRVDAVIGLYGRYDWTDRSDPERAGFIRFLENVVVGRLEREDPEVYRAASPVARVHQNAPPFLVVHGDNDIVIPVDQARAFVQALRRTSRSPVVYAELPGAPHGFDVWSNSRTAETARGVSRFLASARNAASEVLKC